MFDDLVKFKYKPALFTVGTDVFWNDEHMGAFFYEGNSVGRNASRRV